MDFLHLETGAGALLLPLPDVIEVLPTVRLEQVGMGGDPSFCGLLRYRGDVLPVHALAPVDRDLRDDPGAYLVVAHRGTRRLAWLCRDVRGVCGVPPDRLTSLEGSGLGVSAVAQLEDGSLLRVVGHPEGSAR